MRKVKIVEAQWNVKNREFDYIETGECGYFHQFGVDFEEFESGPGNYTTAVVEMADGTIQNYPVTLIKFVDAVVP